MNRSALVVGGSGPTGPGIVLGLLERGYEVTVLHRGLHEAPLPAHVHHLHANPYSEEEITAAVAGREWDLVVSMYGRLRLIAAAFAGRCTQFLGVTGTPVYRGVVDQDPRFPHGAPIPIREEDVIKRGDGGDVLSFGQRVLRGEEAVLELCAKRGALSTIIRYPQIYGPGALVPYEWSVIKRMLDGRESIILPNGGTPIWSRCYAQNAAAAVLSAIDSAKSANGSAFHVADSLLFSFRQWAEFIARILGGKLEVIGAPIAIAGYFFDLRSILPSGSSVILDSTRIASLLDYREPVHPYDATRATVDWYLEHHVRMDEVPTFRDSFDYELEDAVIARIRQHEQEIHEEFLADKEQWRSGWRYPYSE